jgi:hypothetical protein
LTALVMQLALHAHNTGGTPIMHTPLVTEHRGIDDRTMRVDVMDFDGTTNNLEDYIDWEDSLERYFDFKDTLDEHKYKIAKVKLIKLVAT